MPYKDPEAAKAYYREYHRRNRQKKLAYAKKYREENPEKVAAAKRSSYEKKREHYIAVNAAYEKRNKHRPERKARIAVRNAVTSGKIPRASDLDCADCGKPAQHYHHENYDWDRRLDVVALCHPCHGIRHRS